MIMIYISLGFMALIGFIVFMAFKKGFELNITKNINLRLGKISPTAKQKLKTANKSIIVKKENK